MAKCEDCKKEVTENVEKYSKEHFYGRVLCVPCQDKVRAGSDSEGKEEENKGTLGSFGSGAKESDGDLEEYDREVGAELEAEAKELDAKIRQIIPQLSMPEKDNFYGWLKSEYDVAVIDDLDVEGKRRVLENMEKAIEDKEKTVKAEVGELPIIPPQKQIEIDWDNIPAQVLIPKLRKALEYTCQTDKGLCRVVSWSGDSWHNTSINSCQCDDWAQRGSSINPCKHMIRVKYSDEDIRAKLKELGADDLPMKRKTQKDLAVVSEPSIESGMMIQGMTPRLAEVGKIKIGEKSKKMVRGHLLPKKWDHFKIATLLKDDAGRLEMDGEMNEIIGEKCTSLDICLCYDDLAMNMSSSYSWFAQSKLVCMGNGQMAMRRKEDGSEEEITCNPKECVQYKEKKCNPYGRLSVILASANRIGGVYVLRTKGWNSIRNVLSSMAFIRKESGGVLAGLPLRMRLLPMTVAPRDLAYNVKIYAVNIEYPGTLSELKQSGVEEMERRLKLGINMKQTEERYRESVKERMKEEAEDEAKDIAEEFAPEGV